MSHPGGVRVLFRAARAGRRERQGPADDLLPAGQARPRYHTQAAGQSALPGS